MKTLLHLFGFVSLAVLSSCSRPWSTVPDGAASASACEASSGVQSVCAWMQRFDDVIVFAIDGRTTSEEPVFLEGRTVEATDACRTVDPAVVLFGETLASGRGTNTKTVTIPGDHETIGEGDLAPNTRALIPVIIRDGVAVRSGVWPIVENDQVTFGGTTECYERSEVVGLTVTQLLEQVAKCDAVGALVDREFVNAGAACIPREDTTQCALDSDCLGPSSQCIAGVCTANEQQTSD